ncbi:MAG: tetratricopeptide repeat protein, partial [Methylocella sp.]
MTINPDAKEVARQVAAPINEQLQKLVTQVAREKGVEVASLRAVLVKLGEAGIPEEDIPKRLDAKADELLALRAEIKVLRLGPPTLASIAEEAQNLINKGELDAARDALSRGRDAARAVRIDSIRYEAGFLAQEARLDDLQLAYRSAAAKYSESASLVAPFDARQQWRFLGDQARELYSQGIEFGDNAALVEAIDIYRRCLDLAPLSERPLDWAATENDLGNTLLALGERGNGTAQLQEAIAAYHNALKQWTRERVPLDWATAQNNLGLALWTVGERESGTVQLEEAVSAFREVLKEWSRDRVPADWAVTENNLGNALMRLGERESGTSRLEEAISAFREALKENTRELVPLDWAMIQNNLCGALRALGERESGTARLEEAVAACREALQERTRERVPLDWAMTQSNLGNALMRLGERETGTSRLEEAVVAYRNAL